MDSEVTFLETAGQFLPVTVVGAIILFIIKELIEASRRRAANDRKRKAVRRVIAAEIERNNWTIKSLRGIISMIELKNQKPETILEIRSGILGDRYIRHTEPGGAFSESPIGKAHSDALSGNMMILAEIDEAIFEKALKVSDAVKEIDHVIRSIVTHVAGDFEKRFLDGLVEFANDEINDCEKILSDFYKEITGRELEEHRVR